VSSPLTRPVTLLSVAINFLILIGVWVMCKQYADELITKTFL